MTEVIMFVVYILMFSYQYFTLPIGQLSNYDCVLPAFLAYKP